MPTYDYECQECGHRFELFQGITEPPKKKCPECHKNRLQRLIGSGAAVVFKGSGFYQTDYRSESYRKAAEAESKGTTESKGTDGKKAADNGATDGKKSKADRKKPSLAEPIANS